MNNQYAVKYIHKVSQVCRCGHGQYGHHDLHLVHGSMWGHGPCGTFACECTEYEPEKGERHVLPADIMNHGDVQEVARALRQARLLSCRGRLESIRRTADQIVCFPLAHTCHSIIIRSWVDEPAERPTDVVVTGQEGIYRVRWTGDTRCYVNSVVNGGLVGAYRGRWDDAGRLPERVRQYAERLRPGAMSPHRSESLRVDGDMTDASDNTADFF